MRVSGRLAFVPVLVGLGLGALMVRPSSAAAPLETIAGEYAGKLKFKNQVIDTVENPGGAGTIDIGFAAGQEGVFTNGALLLVGSGEDPDELFLGEGRAGNGKFWFTGDAGGALVVLFGSMKGAEGSRLLKGKGVYLSDSEYADIKFTLKEGDSGIVF